MENLILDSNIHLVRGTLEFYELHTSRDCTEINSGSNIHLVRYCGVLRTPYEAETAQKINSGSNIHLVRLLEHRLHRN